MQWPGPYTVIQRVRDSNYTIQFGDKCRTYHANMLKAYVEREPEKVSVANAAINEPEDDPENMLDLYSVQQTEAYEDVDINPALSLEQQDQLKSLIYEFKDVLSDLRGVCDLGRHSVKLTTNKPFQSKPYPLLYAMRMVVDKEIDVEDKDYLTFIISICFTNGDSKETRWPKSSGLHRFQKTRQDYGFWCRANDPDNGNLCETGKGQLPLKV